MFGWLAYSGHFGALAWTLAGFGACAALIPQGFACCGLPVLGIAGILAAMSALDVRTFYHGPDLTRIYRGFVLRGLCRLWTVLSLLGAALMLSLAGASVSGWPLLLGGGLVLLVAPIPLQAAEFAISRRLRVGVRKYLAARRDLNP